MPCCQIEFEIYIKILIQKILIKVSDDTLKTKTNKKKALYVFIQGLSYGITRDHALIYLKI